MQADWLPPRFTRSTSLDTPFTPDFILATHASHTSAAAVLGKSKPAIMLSHITRLIRSTALLLHMRVPLLHTVSQEPYARRMSRKPAAISRHATTPSHAFPGGLPVLLA